MLRRMQGLRCRRGVTSLLVVAVTVTTLVVWLNPFQPQPHPPPLRLEPPGWDEEERWVKLKVGVPQEGGLVLLEGHWGLTLSLRMFCAIESAAMAHPDLPVSVLITGPDLKDTPLYRNLTELYPNLHFHRLDVPELFHGSPLEAWYRRKAWQESMWPRSHFSDALRWLVLWRYGGVYLDFDVVVLRSLVSVPNMAARESHKWVAAGVLRFQPAHHLMRACLEEFAAHFDGGVWGANGPELLTRVLQKRCGLELPSDQLSGCPDVTILPPRSCYPVPWWEWERYVREDPTLAQDLLGDPEVLVLHVWNTYTAHVPVHLASQQPYAVAAHTHCPVTVSHSSGIM